MMMQKMAKPASIQSLNGILPFWKVKNINERDISQILQKFLLRSVDVTFRFVKRWDTSSVSHLPYFGSGVSLFAIGNSCRFVESNMKDKLNSIYRVSISFEKSCDKPILHDISRMNELLHFRNGFFQLHPEIYCRTSDDFCDQKLNFNLSRKTKTLNLFVSAIKCSDLKESHATLDIECETPLLLPHFIGSLEKDLETKITLHGICRTRLGPFKKEDCLTIDDSITYETVRRKLRQSKLLHSDLLEIFYTSEEWRDM